MSDIPNEMLQRFMTAQGGTAFLTALGAKVVKSEPGKSTIRLPYAAHVVGNPDTGVVHGGAITGVLDQACGMAVGSALAAARAADDSEMQGIATLDLRIDYLKAATPGRDITVVGECVKITHQIVFARARAYQDDTEDVIALAAGTFMITDVPGTFVRS